MYSSISNKSIDYDIDKNEINLDKILEMLNHGTIKFQNIESDEVNTDNIICYSIVSNDLSIDNIESNVVNTNNIICNSIVSNDLSIDNIESKKVNTDNIICNNIVSNKSSIDNIESKEVNTDNIICNNIVSVNLSIDNIESKEVNTDNIICNNIVSVNSSISGNITSDLTISKDMPVLNIKNSTVENGEGGTNSIINFKDHEDAILGRIETSHSGTSDDTKGQLKLATNDGTDLTDALTIDSNQNVSISGNLTVDGLTNFKTTVYNNLYTNTETNNTAITIDNNFKNITDIYSFDTMSTLTINLPDTFIDGISCRFILGNNTEKIVINSTLNNINGYVRIMSSDNKPKIYTASDVSNLDSFTSNTTGTIIEINSSSGNKWVVTGDIFTHLPESADNGNPFS